MKIRLIFFGLRFIVKRILRKREILMKMQTQCRPHNISAAFYPYYTLNQHQRSLRHTLPYFINECNLLCSGINVHLTRVCANGRIPHFPCDLHFITIFSQDTNHIIFMMDYSFIIRSRRWSTSDLCYYYTVFYCFNVFTLIQTLRKCEF